MTLPLFQHATFPEGRIPLLAPVHQALPSGRLADVPATVCEELDRAQLASRVKPGDTVAVTAGSRGIADIALVLQTIVETVRRAGGAPFLVPAMGSHGGATVEGQLQVLAECGITEASVGAPIRATTETVELGRTSSGLAVYFDAIAASADATIVVNRVKPHTAFRSEIESGLCKMTAIGLGKRAGAEQAHARGLADSIPEVAAFALQHGNVVAGLALVENARHELALIRGAVPGAFHQTDRDMLRLARDYLPTLPFEHLHVLVVENIGKNLSGSGMDFNVVGMWRRLGGERTPDYEHIVALNLTDESDGNGFGVGIADFTTRRLYEKLDLAKTYTNGLTARAPEAIKIPPVMADDREAIAAALYAAGQPPAPRLAVIASTLELERFWVSEALLTEVSRHPWLSVQGELAPMPFDPMGALVLPV